MKKFAPKYLIVYLIRFYRFFISPMFPSCCRFYPTCSSFSLRAVEKYGLLSGGWISIKRLFRCHPFDRHPGYDPLP